MKRTERRPVKKRVVRSWKQARVMFERWRVNLTYVQVELKLPRVTGVTPIDFIGGGPVEEKAALRTDLMAN